VYADSGRGRPTARGRMRGFGRRGRGGRGAASQMPTKDELDAQLDAYNAKVYFLLFCKNNKVKNASVLQRRSQHMGTSELWNKSVPLSST